MAKIDFQFRPVAGIAGSIEFLQEVKPGDRLELAAELYEANEESVSYGGSAKVNGTEVIRLENCLGPMVPMEDYDSPDAMRERYEQIRDSGAEAHAFGGVEVFPFNRIESECVPGESAKGSFAVPTEQPFFGDHFPRNPVFPGTLLMDANLRFANTLMQEVACPDNSQAWRATGMSNVKLRAFMPPGEMLDLQARVDENNGQSATVFVESRRGKRRNSGARIHYVC